MAILYDHRGRPVQSRELTREVSAPALTGVRSVWGTGSVASGLTPQRLARVLGDAAEGSPAEYLVLAEEMEEREPHYASVLGTRKRAVAGLEPTVEAASDAKRDVDLADAVRELVRRPEFRGLLFDCLDALGKGFSAIEIIWDRSGSLWWPERYERRDPRHFILDRSDGRTIRLLDEADMADGLPLPAYKFVVHTPRLKSGLPIRGGLARLAAAPYMCKAYALADWMAFAEVFGMPLRLGRYGAGATEEDIRKLVTAVANIGTDAAAVIPDSMRIDFQEAGKASGGHELFLRLAEWLDRQTSKGVLGQTMTSDDGSSRAQAEVHNDVRGDIQRDDAQQLAATLNRDLVQPFIDLNFGRQESYPRLLLPVPEPEDLAAFADVLAKLVPLGGLDIQASVVRDRIGLPDPEPGARLLGDREAALNRALNQPESVPSDLPGLPEMLDEIEAEALAEWEELAAPMVDPVLALAERAESYEAFLAGLSGLQLDPEAVVRSLAEATFKARGLGDTGDEV